MLAVPSPLPATHSPSALTGPASWWWPSPASPGSAAAERRRHRGLPSPGHEPGRYRCPEAARRAGTVERRKQAEVAMSSANMVIKGKLCGFPTSFVYR